MREYEVVVIYDLAMADASGPDAAPEHIANLISARGGNLLKTDHWGRRRMAYPIKRALDGDYVVIRAELEPSEVGPLEAALRINERVYRHMVVRADEIPVPPPPREPRVQPGAPAPDAAPAAPVAEAAPAIEAAPAAEALGSDDAPPSEDAEAAAELPELLAPAVAAEIEAEAAAVDAAADTSDDAPAPAGA